MRKHRNKAFAGGVLYYNESYKADINLYENQVTDIHNCNMDRETIYTNSLYLYSDKVVVRTYNHRQQAWMESFDREFKLSNGCR